MIDIEIDKYDDFFNEFNDEELSDNLKKYIENKSNLIDIKESITININGRLNDKEKEKIIRVIHDNYKIIGDYYEKIDKRDEIYRIILIFIGALIIAISSFFGKIINEIFLIAGWVMIWEAFYDLVFASRKRKFKKGNFQRLAKCLVHFNKD